MEQKFIMTAFGKDRPGIVAEISEIIFEHQCNLEDSNMGRLADEFTLILLLSGSGDDLQDRLSRDCKRLEREKDIYVFIRPLDWRRPEAKNGNGYHTIEVEGIDQAGIVYKVSKLLAGEQINIETLRSKKKFSPNSGTAMYAMMINAKVPDTITLDALGDKLEELANELHVDITLD
ncbi:MAG: amino acid-binding protein [Desulfobacter sp.]|nr:MAG: amino acid-binding protein [Desulfobacter sp.]